MTEKIKLKHCFKGSANPNWKHGEIIDKDGYVLVLKPEHPYRNSLNRVRKHRLTYEHYLSIILDEEIIIPSDYHIHHIIPIKDGGDNSIKNLELLSSKEHRRLHMVGNKHGKRDLSKHYCLICKSNNTGMFKKNNSPYWYKFDGGFLCKKCYDRERNRKK